MRDITRLTKAYLRACRLTHAVSDRLPAEIEAAGRDILQLAQRGDQRRADADLVRFVNEGMRPLVVLLERRLKRSHRDLIELLKVRLAFSEFLHTLASEHGRYESTATLAQEISDIRSLLVEDLLGEVEDQSTE